MIAKIKAYFRAMFARKPKKRDELLAERNHIQRKHDELMGQSGFNDSKTAYIRRDPKVVFHPDRKK